MNKQKCQGFMIYGPEAFCPIAWMNWYQYFDSNASDKIMKKINDSIGIHVWNLHSKNTNITVGSKQPYGLIAQKFCPDIYSLAKRVF